MRTGTGLVQLRELRIPGYPYIIIPLKVELRSYLDLVSGYQPWSWFQLSSRATNPMVSRLTPGLCKTKSPNQTGVNCLTISFSAWEFTLRSRQPWTRSPWQSGSRRPRFRGIRPLCTWSLAKIQEVLMGLGSRSKASLKLGIYGSHGLRMFDPWWTLLGKKQWPWFMIFDTRWYWSCASTMANSCQ